VLVVGAALGLDRLAGVIELIVVERPVRARRELAALDVEHAIGVDRMVKRVLPELVEGGCTRRAIARRLPEHSKLRAS
jgi:hypothetical protein